MLKSKTLRSLLAAVACAISFACYADGDPAQPGHTGTSTQESGLQEVVVTAEKRVERIQDVPIPMSSLNALDLVNNSEVRLQDYFSTIPGLSFAEDNLRGAPNITIRGITTGVDTNPTVGVTIDDVPIGSSTFIGGGNYVPDIDPNNLQRIEVLRGPQGALYGASSIGGLVKYVTLDPSTSATGGFLRMGTSGIYNGVSPGYSLLAAANLPVSETFAVRASGFTRFDPGYIYNAEAGQRGVNWGNAYGGLFAALWQPSENLSVKLSALVQRAETNGSPVVDQPPTPPAYAPQCAPPLGDLQQCRLNGTGGYNSENQLYSLNVRAKLGIFELVSVTGYGVTNNDYLIDFSPALGSPTLFLSHITTDKFSQEFRLSTPTEESVKLMVGAFYTHEDSNYRSDLSTADPTTGVVVGPVGSLLGYSNPTKYEEYALFADLTWDITSRFNVQLGGRESVIKQSSVSSSSGIFNGGVTTSIPESTSSDNAFTYLVTPQFKFSPDAMAYARFASGFRPGGPNANYVALQAPPSYGPDTTQNYDLGVKADVLNHALSLDVALYYIDWKKVQVTLNAANQLGVYVANAGEAKSKGVEFSVDSKPWTGLTLSAWIAYNEAELTKGFPAASGIYGVPGDVLPFTSRWAGSLSFRQAFPIAGGWTGVFGGQYGYTGTHPGSFQTTPERQMYPGYAKTNLNIGADYETWSISLYATNVADIRGALVAGRDSFPSYSSTYIQPRTIGLSLLKRF